MCDPSALRQALSGNPSALREPEARGVPRRDPWEVSQEGSQGGGRKTQGYLGRAYGEPRGTQGGAHGGPRGAQGGAQGNPGGARGALTLSVNTQNQIKKEGAGHHDHEVPGISTKNIFPKHAAK